MNYRKFGRLDWQGSALGFGCMRLPVIDGNPAKIDEEEATRMIRHAIDAGVNYLDTAYPYHAGNSERLVGRVLKDGYREKVKLATKMPTWFIQNPADFDKYLNEQLDKLQTDHIDVYLLHGLNKQRWQPLRDLGVREWAEKAIADGRIGHLGFSFHDQLDVFKGIVDDYDGWTMCQIQYNYMNTTEQAGTQGLKYAASKGLAVVVMEPLLGGRLVKPPQAIQELWNEAAVKRSPADWAFRWLWRQPEVSIVLSGMTTMRHVEENLASAAAPDYDVLSEREMALIGRVSAKYEELCPIPCTKCEYCLPCKNGVPIPRLFDIYNTGVMYDKANYARRMYAALTEAEKATACQACHDCEELCPQQIPISEWMAHLRAVFEEGKPLTGGPV